MNQSGAVKKMLRGWSLSISVILLLYVFMVVFGKDYPISKKYKRAKIAGGSAALLTDPIFEIFQNLGRVIRDEYLSVDKELIQLNNELQFYECQEKLLSAAIISSELQNRNRGGNTTGASKERELGRNLAIMQELAGEFLKELGNIKAEIIGKNMEFVEKTGTAFRSIFMLFTPIGKFEGPYQVFRKIFDFWKDRISGFLPDLIGQKIFTGFVLCILFSL